jgi:protein-tyrosine phosphatase
VAHRDLALDGDERLEVVDVEEPGSVPAVMGLIIPARLRRMTRVLFVCLGNICRSPTAEGVFRHHVREAGLEDRIAIDSAGTGGWHVGASPDERATEAARRRGITLEGAARQVTAADFADYDLLLVADAENHAELLRRAPDDAARAKVRHFREFDPESKARGDLDVPDPYYGGEQGFDHVLDLVEAASRGLLAELSVKV